MPKDIAHTYPFKSKTNPANSYTTLLYTDGTTSCNCPGWTRRCTPAGIRECKHTMMVDEIRKSGGAAIPAAKPGKVAKIEGRKFDLSL